MAEDNPLHTSKAEKATIQFQPASDTQLIAAIPKGDLTQRLLRELQYAGALPSSIEVGDENYVTVPKSRKENLADAGFAVGADAANLDASVKARYTSAVEALEARRTINDKTR